MARKKPRKPRKPPDPNYDVWQDPTTKRWVQHVLNDMSPKLADSTFMISLVPDDREGDVKFWVELGASIMLDKPIIAVTFTDEPIPRKLAQVADEVVYAPEGVDVGASDDRQAAMERVMERYG
jgi:hypothetical protein